MGKSTTNPVHTVLFRTNRKRNEIIPHFFHGSFLINSLEYVDIVLSEIKDV